MPFQPGHARLGGRAKGFANKTNKVDAELAAHLAKWKCDPFHVLAEIANGDLPCNVCRGKGKTRYQAGDKERSFERTCQSCYGSKLERISPGERGKAASDLATYIRPKLKSIEHSNPDGSMRPTWQVVMPPPVTDGHTS